MHTVHRKVAAIPPTSPSRALCQYFFFSLVSIRKWIYTVKERYAIIQRKQILLDGKMQRSSS